VNVLCKTWNKIIYDKIKIFDCKNWVELQLFVLLQHRIIVVVPFEVADRPQPIDKSSDKHE
jgi:hypothetical protein